MLYHKSITPAPATATFLHYTVACVGISAHKGKTEALAGCWSKKSISQCEGTASPMGRRGGERTGAPTPKPESSCRFRYFCTQGKTFKRRKKNLLPKWDVFARHPPSSYAELTCGMSFDLLYHFRPGLNQNCGFWDWNRENFVRFEDP